MCVTRISETAMPTNTSNNTHNDTRYYEDRMLLPASQCIPWLVVFIAECLAIVILNIITIIVFVKQRQLQRRSIYLIIHLAIVDLLAGGVSGPLRIESRMANFCDLWKYVLETTWLMHLKIALSIFPVVSLINIAVISIERLHATLFPFRHRLIKKWVYGVIITVIWLMTTGIQAAEQLTDIILLQLDIVYFSYFVVSVFVILVSYVCIFFKVRCSRRPQRHGAAGQRERNLTNTLFLVTIGSLLTWLPLIIYQSLIAFSIQLLCLDLSWKSNFHVHMTMEIIFFANSLINPIIYALRMPELRAGVSQLFRRKPNLQTNQVDLPLQTL